LEYEVIRELFDDGQTFLRQENFTVVRTAYFHSGIDEMKTSSSP